MGTYIDPAGKLLAHVDRLAAWRAGTPAAPVTLEWDLSNRCTLGCEGCHFSHTHTRGPLARRAKPDWYQGTGDLADLDVVGRALGEAATAGVRGVVWTGGGEPLTHPHWPAIVARAAAAGLRQGLYTHGALLTPETVLDLRGPATGGTVDWVVVSLDAVDARGYQAYKGVDRFDAACRSVGLMRAAGLTVGASFLLSAQTWRQAPAMLALGRQLGATYTTFRPLIEVEAERPADLRGPRHWVTEALGMVAALRQEPDVEIGAGRFEAFRDWTPAGRGYATCYGIRFNATITPDGRVWVCPNRRGMAESCLGDLRVETFADLWARHPGQWTDFASCRAMCRLHFINQTAEAVYRPRLHEAFL